ncbi:MAG: DUF3185 family protein [Longimicrobiales bacterium]|nr:DUF3185 family protein [Longimicrobiales bacterium]
MTLLIGGLILMVFGIQASQSFASEVSETFTGSPTDRAIWMIVGGAAAAVAGGILGFGSGRS